MEKRLHFHFADKDSDMTATRTIHIGTKEETKLRAEEMFKEMNEIIPRSSYDVECEEELDTRIVKMLEEIGIEIDY